MPGTLYGPFINVDHYRICIGCLRYRAHHRSRRGPSDAKRELQTWNNIVSEDIVSVLGHLV